MLSHKPYLAAVLALALAGCGASLPKLTTGSLFGGANAPAPPKNDPASRAMNVAATSARAVKCGYFFDPAKLRNKFLESEAAANPAGTGSLPQVYDSTFTGVGKAISEKGADYCTAEQTARIKEALNRNLAGDYTSNSQDPSLKEEGLFSGWAAGSNSSETPFDSKAPFEH